MFEPAAYLAFVIASVILVIVPGPTVTVIVANSLRYGVRAGMLNVAGTQAGLAIMLVVFALGFQVLVERMAGVFEVVRLLGAAYLVWLGVRLWRARGQQMGESDPRAAKSKSFFWQGFLVICSNPKALLLFGAFIPQFVTAGGNALTQILVLGTTFMIVSTVSDGAYAVACGSAGKWLTHNRVVALERISGGMLVLGGVWLALSRRGA